jgi:hypothetical protein
MVVERADPPIMLKILVHANEKVTCMPAVAGGKGREELVEKQEEAKEEEEEK